MKLKLAVAAAATVVLCTLAIRARAQRLPQGAVPDHYDLHLTPDLAKATFAGEVAISVRLAQTTSSITLHAAEIEFVETTISAAGSTQAASVTLNANQETATLTVPRQLPAGSATINIRYNGVLNDQLRGFYRSRANNRKYAITQIGAT